MEFIILDLFSWEGEYMKVLNKTNQNGVLGIVHGVTSFAKLACGSTRVGRET